MLIVVTNSVIEVTHLIVSTYIYVMVLEENINLAHFEVNLCMHSKFCCKTLHYYLVCHAYEHVINFDSLLFM